MHGMNWLVLEPAKTEKQTNFVRLVPMHSLYLMDILINNIKNTLNF